jgi:hypothetical protein
MSAVPVTQSDTLHRGTPLLLVRSPPCSRSSVPSVRVPVSGTFGSVCRSSPPVASVLSDNRRPTKRKRERDGAAPKQRRKAAQEKDRNDTRTRGTSGWSRKEAKRAEIESKQGAKEAFFVAVASSTGWRLQRTCSCVLLPTCCDEV